MSQSSPSPLSLAVTIDERALNEPFVIARETITHVSLTRVCLSDGVHTGRGEGTPKQVYGQSPEGDRAMLQNVQSDLHDQITAADLLKMLPAGSARNALDCALWDLRAKQTGKSIWQLAGVHRPVQPLDGAVTISIGTPEQMAARARKWKDYPLIKIKLDQHRVIERITAIRKAAPATRLMIDANEGWSFDLLQQVAPFLAEARIELLEQPLPRTDETALRDYECPLPLAADESLHTSDDLARLAGLYDWVNIKLDKAGGLTEALKLAQQAKQMGFGLMVGCMVGTSIAMAPAFVVGAICGVRDLDGASMLVNDEQPELPFAEGYLSAPDPTLWG